MESSDDEDEEEKEEEKEKRSKPEVHDEDAEDSGQVLIAYEILVCFLIDSMLA